VRINALNTRAAEAPRAHLAHVLPTLEVSGCLSMATTLMHDLKNQYAHTLLFDSDLTSTDKYCLLYAQSCGAQVLHADHITPEVMDSCGFTGAVLYNVTERQGIGAVLPSIYYSHGIYDANIVPDLVVTSSDYATRHDRFGNELNLDPAWVIPPFMQTRSMRRVRGPRRPFTVGIFTSGYMGKYPAEFVMQMMHLLPDDVGLMINTMSEYRHPGAELAIKDRNDRVGKRMLPVPIMPSMAIRYLIGVDALVYACAPGHYDPYARLVVEAMAFGKAVICERRGAPAELLEHGVNALLFDTPEEAVDHVQRIQTDTKAREMLGVNAQLWASWQDSSAHIGQFKRALRMIGA